VNECSVRSKVQNLLKLKVPAEGLSSDDPRFLELTGMNTKSLLEKWKTEPWFTTCNAFVGRFAIYLGAPRGWLSRGVLQLDWANKDVPGCWVPVDRSGITPPKAGDFYAKPFRSKGIEQKFGHVGIVYDVIGSTITTVDGGQGGSAAGKDYIKWRTWLYNPADMTGWVDLEKYFEDETTIRTKLQGRWEVQIGWKPWYYTFSQPNKVDYADRAQPTQILGTGKWKIDDRHKLRIDWDNLDSWDEWDLPLVEKGQVGQWHSQKTGGRVDKIGATKKY